MKRMVNWLLSGILVSGVAGLAGCGETEEAYNCAEICETYGDCADALGQDVDVTSCTSECETESDRSEDFKDDAEACQNCLDANAECSENLPCIDECAGVVPELAG
jgi:hypothetical protein